MTKITGKCLCGKVSYVSNAAPKMVRRCWCSDCQYWSGGGGTVNVVFETAHLTLTGVLAYHESKADSGNVMKRGFCPSCGTPVTSGTDARPHLLILRAGTLDDKSISAPQMNIWTSSAPAWARLEDDIPAYNKGAPA